MLKSRSPALFALLALACASSAEAHRPVARPLPTSASPYTVELIAESGEALDTYRHGGRYYVLGEHHRRYTIRVKNPTSQRIEAVVSVDGLDVIDGKSADFRNKRGYIVPPYGTLNIEGFRLSTQEVAAFRFSSVSDSYAGRKGKARNVGVVGVAIFREKQPERPIIIMPEHTDYRNHGIHPRRGVEQQQKSADFDEEFGADDGEATRERPTASPPADATRPNPSGIHRDRVGTTSGTGGAMRGRRPAEDEYCCGEPAPAKKERSGLGTAWGEHRYSSVQFTRFVREDNGRPSAIAELRYNNRSGLEALGIRFAPEPDPEELYTRETANPFPGSEHWHFAEPPR